LYQKPRQFYIIFRIIIDSPSTGLRARPQRLDSADFRKQARRHLRLSLQRDRNAVKN
jgi:hypothetical protein